MRALRAQDNSLCGQRWIEINAYNGNSETRYVYTRYNKQTTAVSRSTMRNCVDCSMVLVRSLTALAPAPAVAASSIPAAAAVTASASPAAAEPIDPVPAQHDQQTNPVSTC